MDHQERMHTAGLAASRGELGCGHYKRKCKVIAPCCDRAYTCRECHDEAEPDHEMDSKAVQHMICMECNTRQRAARAPIIDMFSSSFGRSQFLSAVCELPVTAIMHRSH